MRYLILLLTLPTFLFAQDLQFQYEPEAFPVEIDGWQPYCPWAGHSSESKPELCDIDADSDLDFFVGEFLGYCEFYENIGDGNNPDLTFSSGDFDSTSIDARFNPCFGDIDADGDFDLIFSDDHPHLWLYENIGDSSQYEFQLISNDLIPGPPWCRGPVLIDIDADGDFDLFGASWGNISFFRNDGTSSNFSFTTVTGTFSGINVGGWASPEFVDIDADNDYDLFIGEEYGKIWFYQNDGDSANYDYTLISTNYWGIDVGDLSAPEFADIDSDGDFDLFVGKESDSSNPLGDVFFYENVGDAYNPQFVFITTTYLSMDFGYFGIRPRFVDINDDLLIDFLGGTGNNLVYMENETVDFREKNY
ncbi:MAG: VCBS repeat-containing protein [bacterium]